MRQIFNDKDLERSYLQNGFAVVDFLSEVELASLQELYTKEKFPPTGTFYLTIWKDSPEHRLMIHQKIQETISSSYQKILFDYKPIISSFAVKQAKSDSAWHPHQDDTFVDENNFASLSIWIPLVDTDATNGTLAVLPGSHLVYTGPRSPNIVQPFKNNLESIAEDLIDINLKAGQAVIFDHRVIHGSKQNSSGMERVAVVTVLIPREANLTYLYLDKDTIPNMIKEYIISEKYYLEAPLGEFSKEPDPVYFKLIATYPFSETQTQ